jgi:23S rRNA (guanosine2251-2'-O)-methyltransferase
MVTGPAGVNPAWPGWRRVARFSLDSPPGDRDEARMSDDQTPAPRPARPKSGRPGGKPGFKPGRGGFRGKPGGRPQERRGPARDDLAGKTVLYGWHPVAEALRNPLRKPLRLLATENAFRRLEEELGPDLAARGIEAEMVPAHDISRLLEPDAVHQGLYLEAEPLETVTLETLPDDALVLALDQVTDPHNVGAIARTAAAFGVTAILTTARHSPAATGVLAKAASGGLEHVPFLIVRNLSDALSELGERGFRRVGLDSEGTAPLPSLGSGRPLVLVLGAEGKGLRQRTRDNCDVVARLDLPGAIKSLNVSNAAAIALFAVSSPA